MFASACDDSAAAVGALADLVSPGLVLQVPDVVVPGGLSLIKAGRGVQVVATGRVRAVGPDEDPVELTDADAPEMLALATLTEPGPFLESYFISLAQSRRSLRVSVEIQVGAQVLPPSVEIAQS